MAFRILNGEELSLLDDNRRKQYESELDIYQQRLTFVEQLEAHANANIQPYEPKLESVAVIGKIEAKSFTKSEYVITPCNPVAKPDLQVNSFVMAEPINPVLPVLSKRPSVKAAHIKKVERTQPELPSIGKPFAPAKRFGRFERNRPDLPAVVKSEVTVKSYNRPEQKQLSLPSVVRPSMQTELLLKPVSIDNSNIKASMPKVGMPSVELYPFVAPEKAQHGLPEVSVKLAGVRSFSKPELSDVELPAAAKPNMNVKPFKKVNPIQTNLSGSPGIAPVKAAFKKPELTNAELPAVVKPSVNIRSLGEIQPTTPSLPKISKINIQSLNFSKPNHTTPALPVIPKMSAEPKAFKPNFSKPNHTTSALPVMPKISVEPKAFKPNFSKPNHTTPALPAIPKTSVEPKAFKPLELNQPHVIAVAPPTISIKSFAKIESKAIGLPSRSVMTIPDAYEKLKDLLPAASEESEALEGIG